jgi:hypothetical protein
MLVSGEHPFSQCPVMGQFEDTGWSSQCPMFGQWNGQPNDMCYSAFNHNYVTSVPCYRNVYDETYRSPWIHSPMKYPQTQSLMIPNLPCSLPQQEWDYNSMCYDVNGQACQYTNVVDLEDFM